MLQRFLTSNDGLGSWLITGLRMRTKPEMLQQALGVRPGGDVTVDPGKWKSLLSTGIFHEIHGYYKPTPEGAGLVFLKYGAQFAIHFVLTCPGR